MIAEKSIDAMYYNSDLYVSQSPKQCSELALQYHPLNINNSSAQSAYQDFTVSDRETKK
jgi:hypothetical protein